MNFDKWQENMANVPYFPYFEIGYASEQSTYEYIFAR